MHTKKTLILILVCINAIFAFGQSSPGSEANPMTRPRLFDVTALDTGANPCEDFDQYACGTWRKNNPVPSDQVFWARYNQLAEYNREVLHKIVEQAAIVTPGRSGTAKVVGDFYSSCMNETAADKNGAASLQPELKRIAAISSREQLMDAVARLHVIGVPALFEFTGQPDLHDATKAIATIVQGGLGLPDRDYYLNPNDNAKQTRTRYLAHVAKMFTFAGDDPATI